MANGITVNFNGLRRNACNAFDKVVESAVKCREENGNDPFFEDLAEKLNDLRFFIAGVALCYDESQEMEDVLGDRTLLSMNEGD